MSVRIMTLVWDAELAAGEKLVLLALADCANDEGHCWPSVGTLTRKTGQSERTVQAMLKSLADAGHISRDQRVGKGCYYTIHPRNNCTPAKSAPPQKTAQTPAKSAPKPSVTVNDDIPNGIPSKRAKPAKAKPVECPDDVSPEVWADFLRHRKAKRAIVTNRVLNDFRREAEDVGWPLERAMQESITRGWQGFLAKWVKDDGNRTKRNSQASAGAGSRDGFLNACFDAAMGGNGTGDPFGRAANQARNDSAPAFPQIATSWPG